MEAAPAKTNRPDRATGGKVRPSRLLREYGCVSQISPDGPAAPLLSQAQSTGFREDFPKFSHIAISSPNALAGDLRLARPEQTPIEAINQGRMQCKRAHSRTYTTLPVRLRALPVHLATLWCHWPRVGQSERSGSLSEANRAPARNPWHRGNLGMVQITGFEVTGPPCQCANRVGMARRVRHEDVSVVLPSLEPCRNLDFLYFASHQRIVCYDDGQACHAWPATWQPGNLVRWLRQRLFLACPSTMRHEYRRSITPASPAPHVFGHRP